MGIRNKLPFNRNRFPRNPHDPFSIGRKAGAREYPPDIMASPTIEVCYRLLGSGARVYQHRLDIVSNFFGLNIRLPGGLLMSHLSVLKSNCCPACIIKVYATALLFAVRAAPGTGSYFMRFDVIF